MEIIQSILSEEINWHFLLIFFFLSVVNVIFSTVKSVVTINGGIRDAARINSLYYGFYTVVLIYTTSDFPTWQKVVVAIISNYIGVCTARWGMAKTEKEKMWKIEFTIPSEKIEEVDGILKDVPHSYIRLSDKHTVFNCYCATREESKKVKETVNSYGARWFVSESKQLY